MENNTRDLVLEYESLAAETVEAFRSAADALERGELLTQDAEEHLVKFADRLKNAGGQMREAAENLGADVSGIHTVEEWERVLSPLEIDQTLMWLDAMQDITASDEQYAAPMRELQQEAAQMAQILRTTGEPPSEKTLRMAERSKELFDTIDRFENRRPDLYETIYKGPSVSTMINVGLACCAYRRAKPGHGSNEDAADDVRREQQTVSVTQAASDRQNIAPEVLSASDALLVDMPGDRMIHPLSKLRNYKPNPSSFLSALKTCGWLAPVVVGSAYLDDVVTLDGVVSLMNKTSDAPHPSRIRDDAKKTIRQLVRRGILAGYKIKDQVLYVLTRFGYESMQMPQVQRALQLDYSGYDANMGLTAQASMSAALLMLAWVRSVIWAKIEDWLWEETETENEFWEALDGESRGRDGTMRIPKGYGREDEDFLVSPYEPPRLDESSQALYVVIRDDTVPFEEDVEECDGSLLLFKGELYERRNGAWNKMKRTVPQAGQRAKRPTHKTRKRMR